MQITFAENPQIEINSFKKTKTYLINISSDTSFKDTVVNRTMPSLHEGSLEIALTVPLM